MKATFCWVMVLAVVVTFGFAGLAFGQETTETKTYTMGDKLYRGFMNTVTSPLEIFYGMHKETTDKSLLLGLTYGLFKGALDGGYRLGAGIIDIATFPFDFPKAGKASIVDPEYVWDKPGLKLA